jgi:hypothetical protein
MTTTPSVHILKSWPAYFPFITNGSKKFELRKNDRDFKVGDTLILVEFDPATEKFSGLKTKVEVSFLLKDFPGLETGYVIMSLTGIHRLGLDY